MRREMRREAYIGLGLYAIFAMLRVCTNTHHFILGGLCGLAICFEVVGFLPQPAYDKLKKIKKSIIKK